MSREDYPYIPIPQTDEESDSSEARPTHLADYDLPFTASSSRITSNCNQLSFKPPTGMASHAPRVAYSPPSARRPSYPSRSTVTSSSSRDHMPVTAPTHSSRMGVFSQRPVHTQFIHYQPDQSTIASSFRQLTRTPSTPRRPAVIASSFSTPGSTESSYNVSDETESEVPVKANSKSTPAQRIVGRIRQKQTRDEQKTELDGIVKELGKEEGDRSEMSKTVILKTGK